MKHWRDVSSIAQDTVDLVEGTELPLELGDVANIHHARRNTLPVPRPPQYNHVVHMDIGYGDCVAIGGSRYVLTFVDRATRFVRVYGLKSLSHDNIIDCFQRYSIDAGSLPTKLYTDFDNKLLAGKTEK